MEPVCGMESDDDGQPECPYCGGQGEIMVCWDDLCQGQGYCIHGDGVDLCPVCEGSGEA